MEKATVREIENLKGKRVFLRADLNVPQDEKGNVTDDTRIRESLATLRYLTDKGARVVLCSHLGRPKSKDDKSASLKPVANRLKEMLKGANITLAKDCIGAEVEAQVKALKDGQVLMLENIRYYKEETDNDPKFAKTLAKLADYYVNDAFGAAHRAHASTEGIAKYLPSVAGFLLEKEIKILGESVNKPKRPLTVIIGGKKVADKIPVIDNLLKIADTIIIGGGMTYTFVKAQGGSIGNSICDNSRLEYCNGIIKAAKEKGIKLLLSVDTVAADKFAPDANTKIVDVYKIPEGWEGLDLGPKTIENIKKAIKDSGTIIWCGPLGVFEFEKFATGTREIAKAITSTKAVTIVGGGDSASAVVSLGFGDKFTHISTGGGASLELLEGKTLPGVAALLDMGSKIK
ncbi:phosphoglycerate kinase [Holotrichia oblita]|nr:phosphoglycerate kinase [Holotrichia oblita]